MAASLDLPHSNREVHDCLGGQTLSVDSTSTTEGDSAGYIPVLINLHLSGDIGLCFVRLRDSGLKPYAKLGVAGYELDFALLDEGIKLNVEIDGAHHIDVRGKLRRQDIRRDRILRQRGWEVLRASAWRCHADLGPVLEDIRAAQDRLLGR